MNYFACFFLVACFITLGWCQINAVLHDSSFVTKFGRYPNELDDDNVRIITHLEYVRDLLEVENKNGSTIHPSVFSILFDYISEKQFPHVFVPSNNTNSLQRVPCFIDDKNNYCAIGYIMKRSGFNSLAHFINENMRFHYVHDMSTEHPAFQLFLQRTGLTLQHLSWIQPQYRWLREAVQVYPVQKSGYIQLLEEERSCKGNYYWVSGTSLQPWYTTLSEDDDLFVSKSEDHQAGYQFTISLWMNYSDYGRFFVKILEMGEYFYGFAQVFASSKGGGHFHIIAPYSDVPQLELKSQPISLNKTIHVAIVVYGLSFSLIVDGEVQNTTLSTIPRLQTNNMYLCGKDYGFHGFIKDVRIYPTALSLQEIRELAKQ